ncbi:RHS repeat-associated core domain-containing protein [Singulisphaera rosea]
MLGYDAADEMTSVSRTIGGTGTAVTTSMSYDAAGRMTTLTHQIAGGSGLASYVYTFDNADRLTSEKYDGGGVISYIYDAGDQLTNTDGARHATYSYDLAGNRSMSGYATIAYNEMSSSATATTTYSYTYDAEGNMTSRTDATGAMTTFAWDYRNELVGATIRNSSGTITEQVTYTYDAVGDRIGVKVLAGQRWAVYDGDQVYGDFNGVGAVLTRYLDGPAVDELLARTSSGVSAWYLTDRFGSVRDIADTSGTLIRQNKYDGYGQFLSGTGSGGDAFMFAAMRYDTATGLYYDRARWYDGVTGRFVSQDPMGFAAGDANLYRYVKNSPTNYIDPTGMYPGTNGWSGSNLSLTEGPINDFFNWMAGGITSTRRVLDPVANRARRSVGMSEAWDPVGRPDKVRDPAPVPEWTLEGTKQALDGIGVLDPSPATDSASAVISLLQGNLLDAGISLLAAFVPYIGDLAKGLKYGGKLAKFADDGSDLVSGFGRAANRSGLDDASAVLARRADEGGSKFARQMNDAPSLGKDTCFAAGTPILTPSGFKPIEALRVDDLVLSAPDDDPDHPVVARRVLGLYQGYSPLLGILVCGRLIRTTAKHPFWVQGRGWTDAQHLKAGDHLRTHLGRTVVVECLEYELSSTTVYNFEVEEYHTYFVGRESWGFSAWSHNDPLNILNRCFLPRDSDLDIGLPTYRDPKTGQLSFLEPDAPKKNPWSYMTEWHDKRATELFGPGSGRNNIGGRNYDKRFAGRDIEFKSDNFSKGERSQDSLDRMNTQIGKDIENLNNGVANPHWHFDHDPRVAPEMAPLLKRLKDAGMPWTWGQSTPSF